jgi:hypothetical protein
MVRPVAPACARKYRGFRNRVCRRHSRRGRYLVRCSRYLVVDRPQIEPPSLQDGRCRSSTKRWCIHLRRRLPSTRHPRRELPLLHLPAPLT